jgi:hypothetical protein
MHAASLSSPKNWTNGGILSITSTNLQSAVFNFAGVVRNRWPEWTSAREEREEF